MRQINAIIDQLVSIRNRYGKGSAAEKLRLLAGIDTRAVKSKHVASSLYSALLFLLAYPDNKTVHKAADKLLTELENSIRIHEVLNYSLYNTGITGTTLCAAFSFEMIKWLRKTRPADIKFNSFEAGNAQVQSILSVVMSKTESEIMQDANEDWKSWLKQIKEPGQELLDQFIAIFDSSDIRPEVKEELWNTIGINVEINFSSQCRLPDSLTKLHYHSSLVHKPTSEYKIKKPVRVALSNTEAEQLVDCTRMILLRKLRELDPISFSSAKLVSLYHLERGMSIALIGMVPAHRHPIDSYMGYLVFKNGLPVAYAGSWILFDSARIGLNVFADYRGGEAKYIFDQVLQLHEKVYHLKRFTVDPYQVGKHNSDGISSGVFWVYYQAGFRPIEKEQLQLAENEAGKIKADHNYRSSAAVLNTLSNSRLELVLQKGAVRFDATDISRLYATLLSKNYKTRQIEKQAAQRLATMLGIKNYQGENISFVLKNWGILLLAGEKELQSNAGLRRTVKELVNLKAGGSEELYISGLQKAVELRRFIEELIKKYK